MWIILYLVRVGESVGKFVVSKNIIFTIFLDVSEDFLGAVNHKDSDVYKQ